MTIRIYGAGMAGLLTANMLRRYRPVIHEAQPTLPDNHGALLRFRTNAVATVTGQPFRRVNVTKAVKTARGLRTEATLREANQYSLKVTGELHTRSVLDLSPCERFIAPQDFLSTMARDVVLQVNQPLTVERLREHKDAGDPVISTIPMPALMSIVEWPDQPTFAWRPVWSVIMKLKIPANVYQTIYYPGEEPYYRASMTGDRLIIEYMREPGSTHSVDALHTLDDFGIGMLTEDSYTVPQVKRQEYGKLSPTSELKRQEFMLAMTDTWGVYSVGRFATWRQILLDDVVSDVHKVDAWITQRSSYARRLEMTS